MDGKNKLVKKAIAVKALLGLNKFIDKKKQPKSVNFAKMLMSLFLKHNFATMGQIQMKTLFLGMMHFQDEYTYDIHRVEKCDIHYAMPDGQVLPFCTFNVFPEVYRDKAQKQYSIPTSEWQKSHPGWAYPKDKYMRNTKEIEATQLYIKTYGTMIDYFALGVNGGKPVKNFSNPAAAKKVVPPIAQKAAAVVVADCDVHRLQEPGGQRRRGLRMRQGRLWLAERTSPRATPAAAAAKAAEVPGSWGTEIDSAN